MSTTRSLPVLFLSVALAAQARAHAEELPPAPEILAKCDARLGDPAARKGIRTLVMRGNVLFPDCTSEVFKPVKGRFEEIWLAADRAYSVVEWGTMKLVVGTAGAFSWSHDPMGIVIKEGDEQLPMRRSCDLGRRAGWKEMYASAETVGTEELADRGGRKHYKLVMKPAVGESETWFVDAETFDLGAVESSLPDLPGGSIKIRTYFSDFRDVSGIRFPHEKLMKMGVDPTRFEYHYESIEVNAAVKPEQVAPSAEVLAALKDPTKRLQSPSANPDECAIEEIAAQPVLSIRVTSAADAVEKTLATLIPEVLGVMTEMGGEMAGPPYCRFHTMDADKVDLEAGMPLKKKVDGKGRVKATELPAGKTATTWHIGTYDSVAKSQARLAAWLKEKSLQTAGGHWEVYWTDPGVEPDPAKWRTRIYWPVK